MNDELETIRTRHNNVEPPKGFYVSLRDGQQAHTDRATLLRHVDRLSAELAKERERRVEVEEALRPFALVAENDIGSDETDRDIFRPMLTHNHAPRLSVGDLRRARAALNQEPGQ